MNGFLMSNECEDGHYWQIDTWQGDGEGLTSVGLYCEACDVYQEVVPKEEVTKLREALDERDLLWATFTFLILSSPSSSAPPWDSFSPNQ